MVMVFVLVAGFWSALGDTVTGLVLASILFSPLLFLFWLKRWATIRSHRKNLNGLAGSLGLVAVPGTSRLTGQIDGFTVDVEVKINSEGYYVWADVAVGDPERIPASLSVGRENPLAFGEHVRGEDVLTGDAKFDAVFHCAGDEVDVVARLNGGVRRSLLESRFARCRLRNGQVISGSFARIAELDRGIRIALHVASMLAVRSQDLPQRLCENATRDRLHEVQLRNLQLLQSRFPGSPFLEKACRALVRSPNAGVRLHAARLLGMDGYQVLRRLAEDGSLEAGIRAESMRALAGIDGASDSARILWAGLSCDVAEVRRAAIEGLGMMRHRPALLQLAEFSRSTDPETLCVLALALERIGDPAAEPALLRCLDSDSTAARLAAVHALDRIGTIASVQKLLELTHGLRSDGDLKEAARRAAASIQARHPQAAPGQLSLATPAPGAGELSLAPGEGRLSITEAEPTNEARWHSAEAPPEVDASPNLRGPEAVSEGDASPR